jgi:hypothetical protein
MIHHFIKVKNHKNNIFLYWIIIPAIIFQLNLAWSGWFSKDISVNQRILFGTWKINFSTTKALKQNSQFFSDKSFSFLLTNVLPQLKMEFSEKEMIIYSPDATKYKYKIIEDEGKKMIIEHSENIRKQFVFLDDNTFVLINENSLYLVFEKQ